MKLLYSFRRTKCFRLLFQCDATDSVRAIRVLYRRSIEDSVTHALAENKRQSKSIMKLDSLNSRYSEVRQKTGFS